jgi:DNA mismatch endonuclease (patch repair protein)
MKNDRLHPSISQVRSTETKCERVLRSALWRMGLRFRKNYADLPGKPDIVFIGHRVAVFCDGDFWHGNSFQSGIPFCRIRRNAEFWFRKIEMNIKRDAIVNESLMKMGWTVLRYWESDILHDTEGVANSIYNTIKN